MGIQRLLIFVLSAVVAAWPFVGRAATVDSVLGKVQSAVNSVSPVLASLAVAVFLYGVVLYIFSGSDAKKEKEARGYLVYGLIGLFVLVAFWALVSLVVASFGLDNENVMVEYPESPLLDVFELW